MFYLNLLGVGSHSWKELGMVGCPFAIQSPLMTRQYPKRKFKVSDDTTGPNSIRQEDTAISRHCLLASWVQKWVFKWTRVPQGWVRAPDSIERKKVCSCQLLDLSLSLGLCSSEALLRSKWLPPPQIYRLKS